MLAVALMLIAHIAFAAQDAPSAQQALPLGSALGYWKGNIRLPRAALPIQVSLSQTEDGAMQRSISIPLQNIKDYRLDAVTVSGRIDAAQSAEPQSAIVNSI